MIDSRNHGAVSTTSQRGFVTRYRHNSVAAKAAGMDGFIRWKFKDSVGSAFLCSTLEMWYNKPTMATRVCACVSMYEYVCVFSCAITERGLALSRTNIMRIVHISLQPKFNNLSQQRPTEYTKRNMYSMCHTCTRIASNRNASHICTYEISIWTHTDTHTQRATATHNMQTTTKPTASHNDVGQPFWYSFESCGAVARIIQFTDAVCNYYALFAWSMYIVCDIVCDVHCRRSNNSLWIGIYPILNDYQ